MTVKEIEMPHLGESVTEASIMNWLVQEGDKIQRYDPIGEVISDKVTTEIPSNYSGVVKQILVETDKDVKIGTPILSIEVEGEDTEKISEGERTEEFMSHINEEIDKAAEEQLIEVKTQPQKTESQSTQSKENKVRYSPAVVRIAQERGIDLSKVNGTGKHGRITRKDVQNFDINTVPEKKAEKQSEQKREPSRDKEQRAVEASTQEKVLVVPADGVRKFIAKRLTQSSSEIPHAWMTIEADVTNLVKLREDIKEDFKEREGVPLSYFPFFVKAIIQAIRKNPVMNTSWDDGNIIYHKNINLSIAVATKQHLFVPVIHQADQYSVAGLTKEIYRLATAAKNGKLENKEMQNGTFTVNNTGSFGSIQSMGIINHPQAAILQVESINKRVVPIEDNGFKVADMVNLCLSIDHRILDGLQAGKFLQDVKDNLKRFKDESDLY